MSLLFSCCKHKESSNTKSIDDVSIDYLTKTELRNLRKNKNKTHLEAAHKSPLREPIKDKDYFYEHQKDICKKADLEEIKTNKQYCVARLIYSIPYLNEEAVEFLDLLSKRMEASFAEKEVMYYRFVLTSVLRTEKDQRILQKVNVNATPSETSHYFGTTFDISQTRFLLGNSDESVYSYRLRNVLARELLKLQEEGKCYVVLESREKCFHVTVIL